MAEPAVQATGRQWRRPQLAFQLHEDVCAAALDHFVSKPTFEEICRSWVLDQVEAGTWPAIERVGAWWGPVPAPTPEQPRRQAEAELEVVGVAGKRVVVAGEVKWTREPVGFSVLNHLRDVVRRVPGVDNDTELVLFGRRFDARLKAAAFDKRVRLWRPNLN